MIHFFLLAFAVVFFGIAAIWPAHPSAPRAVSIGLALLALSFLVLSYPVPLSR